MQKILFTGGGSAGHVIPNTALIEELLFEGKIDVCYIGTNGIERDIIAKWNIPYYTISCPKLIRGGGWKGFKNNIQIPFALFRAYKQAKKALLALRPNVVFSKGGYVALPVVWAAKKLKIPCFAHESDLSVGLSNKLSARACKAVFTSFPETAKAFKNGVHSGAPIKKSVFAYSKTEARKRLQIDESQTVILVFGGGSGSKIINDTLRQYVKYLTEKYVLLHVCGKGNKVKSSVKNYHQFEFVTDMGVLYACADMIVARAGAGTVFETLALKKPALFIPLEGQTRGDQKENAEYFAKKGLCKILSQSQIEKLPLAIEQTLFDKGLKEKLENVSFPPANDFILQELKRAMQ